MALPLTPIIQSASLAFSFATNSRNVFKMIKEVIEDDEGNFTDEIMELTYLVSCIQEPFNLCCQLQTRQETINSVDSAVAFTKHILKSCERFFDEKEKHDTESCEVSPNWKTWLTKEKKTSLSKLLAGVKTCIDILNLSLQTVAVRFGKFSLVEELKESMEAVEKAHRLKFQLDSGRCKTVHIALGEVYQFVETAVKRKVGQKSKDLVNKGFSSVSIVPGREGQYVLQVRLPCDEVDASENIQQYEEISFTLPSKSFSCTRKRKVDLNEDILLNYDNEQYDLCYKLSQEEQLCFLAFESPGGVSAQAFESLINQLQESKGPTSGSVENLTTLMDKVGFETPAKG
mmetsp:Transcript_13852/g.15786  ORF Transcript_13852/g.15786 Transcript_13852/m.15786 type:complete len:344 (-) Transcript_13852:155-1186(-)